MKVKFSRSLSTMGSIMSRRYSHLRPAEGRSQLVTAPNPDPENFRIERVLQTGKLLGAMVLYPDCENFEGRKLMVFEGLDEEELRERTSLDPHFTEEGEIIARFKPDEQGWQDAVSFMELRGQ
jgi:hypothetical protein